VPPEKTAEAVVPGIPNARLWPDLAYKDLLELGEKAREREKTYLQSIGHEGDIPPLQLLVLSAGGAEGAFGAGLLVGWTESGDRPEFNTVTGVSTGALTAPFAFLGPNYDRTLETLYTTVSSKDIFRKRGISGLVTLDAAGDSTPLRRLIENHVNEEVLHRVAKEYEVKGRLLLIATTDLDARRPVIWNMGAIAASKDPKAIGLFRKILLASASIPGVFPPVMIDVEVDGVAYQEMHVDGGASSQVFLFPSSLGNTIRKKGLWSTRERTVYIIRNARLDPDWASIERRTLSILGRAISSLIQTQGIGDLYQIYLNAQQNEMDFNLAYIGEDFDVEHREDFDTEYMRALFDYGYQLSREDYRWQKRPPGLAKKHLE
jgi:predicted patatin/cPLA2 family phospholipase